MADVPDEARTSVADATAQVRRMARRTALLYHYMAEVLVERLGEEQATELLREAIRRYGTESGVTVRANVEALGLPLTADNFNLGGDLPTYGWEAEPRPGDDGVVRPAVTYCPLAAVWLEKGSQRLGRLYCGVDQAKYIAYNGQRCVHVKNVLDGDECCMFAIGENQSERGVE